MSHAEVDAHVETSGTGRAAAGSPAVVGGLGLRRLVRAPGGAAAAAGRGRADRVREELMYVGLQTRVGADRLVPEAVEPHEWRHYTVDADTLRLSVASAGRAPRPCAAAWV